MQQTTSKWTKALRALACYFSVAFSLA